jgi:hypothetical protein
MISTTLTCVDAIHGQAFIDARSARKKILLINKKNAPACVQLEPRDIQGVVSIVDEQSGDGPARVKTLRSSRIELAPFAVALVVQEN